MNTQTLELIEALRLDAARMNDAEIIYQLEAHERHNDTSWSFDVFKAEADKRNLSQSDWRDPSEIAFGA